MLYDNALLLQTYLEAYQVTKNPDFEQVSRLICKYLLETLQNKELGGFFSGGSSLFAFYLKISFPHLYNVNRGCW